MNQNLNLITQTYEFQCMGYLTTVGLLSTLLGFVFYLLGSRSRGEMETRIGWFKGPIWFLLIIFGLFLMVLDSIRF
jgi:hypothetical protein